MNHSHRRNLHSPQLMKKGVKLHPLLVVFGVFAGGDIGGVAGIFLSVPILALLRLVYYESRKSRAVSPDPIFLPRPLVTTVRTEAPVT